MNRLRTAWLISSLFGVPLIPCMEAANNWINGTNISVPPNIVTAGSNVVYEALQTIQNQSQFEYSSGSVGALIAGQRINLKPGFKALTGSDVWAFIDANFNGISDYGESSDADGDGYFDALEQLLGSNPNANSTSYSVDVNGDGALDVIEDVAHCATPSSYIPSYFSGYRNKLTSYYTAYGYYYSVYVSYGGATIPGFFPSLDDYFNINFGVTYYYFDLVGWRYTTSFFAEAGRQYVLYVSGAAGWEPVTNIIQGTGAWMSVYSPLFENLWEFPQFVQLVRLGFVQKTQVNLPAGGGVSVGTTGTGGGTVTLQGGATATIGANGTATITLPNGGGTISISANGAITVPGGTVLAPGSGVSVTLPGGIVVTASSGGISGSIIFPGGSAITVNSNGTGSIVLPGGTIITRGTNGVLHITLPPGTNPAVATAVDILGQIIQNGPNVAWSVRKVVDAVNGIFGPVITLPSGGVLGAIDLGVTGAGAFQVGVKVGDSDIAWFDATVATPDLDIVHPVSGEVPENLEDAGGGETIPGHGGLVALRRGDTTPKTKLLLRAIPNMPVDLRFRVIKDTNASTGNISAWLDPNGTQQVVFGATEFPCNVDTTLYVQGEEVTASHDLVVTQQIGNGTVWGKGDTVSLTVVIAEIPIVMRAFIPHVWTAGEEPVPVEALPWPTFPYVIVTAVSTTVGGDTRQTSSPFGYGLEPRFRLAQSVILTPYSELHGPVDVVAERQARAADFSHYYIRDEDVPLADRNANFGEAFVLGAAPNWSYPPPAPTQTYGSGSRTINAEGREVSSLTLSLSGEPGTPTLIPSGTVPNIDFTYVIEAERMHTPGNPRIRMRLQCTTNLYPAYEVIVQNSDGEGHVLYEQMPLPATLPGPRSLNTSITTAAGPVDIK